MSSRGNKFTSFAEEQFSKAGSSGLYDAARPDYPAPAVAKILNLLPKEKQQSTGTVVELGSGTGIFSRLLLRSAAAQSDGSQSRINRLLCVEPSQGMRENFEVKLAEMTDRDESIKVECVDGLFDQIPAETGSADVLIAAQAFHWVGHDGTSAIKEISRVLAPGGKAIFIWNMEDRTQPWVAKLRDLYEEFENDTPQYRHMYWKMIYDTDAYNDNFEPHERETFERYVVADEELVVNRLVSKSYITALDDETQRKLVEGARQVVRQAGDIEWVDRQSGKFKYPYTTDVWIHTKKSA